MGEKQFVIQEHTTPEGVHWDLMLEGDGVLRTFRLADRPETALERPIDAEKIFDHPLRFLTYEGPVQQGTGRVRIVDRGPYSARGRTETQWDLHLDGVVLAGDFSLKRLGHNAWRFCKT